MSTGQEENEVKCVFSMSLGKSAVCSEHVVLQVMQAASNTLIIATLEIIDWEYEEHTDCTGGVRRAEWMMFHDVVQDTAGPLSSCMI